MITGKPTCRLFTTSLEELGERFTLHASSITAKQARGVSPKFLEKIWSISPLQAIDAVEHNSQHNR